MTVLAPRRTAEATAGTAGMRPEKRFVMIVGYDGSEPACHALDQAADLLKGREGSLEVVYVPQLPAGAALSGVALAKITQGLDDQATALADEVGARLAGHDIAWRFQRREGAVASELVAVASGLQDRYGDSADIVIVVGGPAHRYHHLVGSVGSGVIRSRRFPVMTVP